MMVEPRVGYVLRPRPGIASIYIGRTMPRYKLRDQGWGNPFRLGINSDDPVTDYNRWLDTQSELLARLPELAGRDLLCWCRKTGSEPTFPFICHGDVLLTRLAQWRLRNPLASIPYFALEEAKKA